jgi:hypothetical protein
MLFAGYVYEVKALVSLTPAEIDMLMNELCPRHYDWVCKSAGLQGGFIYGLANQLAFKRDTCEPKQISVEWEFRKCDLTAKVCEIANYISDDRVTALAAGVHMGMLKACHKISEESKRLNNKPSVSETGIVQAAKEYVADRCVGTYGKLKAAVEGREDDQ